MAQGGAEVHTSGAFVFSAAYLNRLDTNEHDELLWNSSRKFFDSVRPV